MQPIPLLGRAEIYGARVVPAEHFAHFAFPGSGQFHSSFYSRRGGDLRGEVPQSPYCTVFGFHFLKNWLQIAVHHTLSRVEDAQEGETRPARSVVCAASHASMSARR